MECEPFGRLGREDGGVDIDRREREDGSVLECFGVSDVRREIKFELFSWVGGGVGELERCEWIRSDVETDIRDQLEGVGSIGR